MKTHLLLPFLLLCLTLPAAQAAPANPRLAGVKSFVFGLGVSEGEPAWQRLKLFDLAIVDGSETSAAAVANLKTGAAVVLGYLSVGTIEPWRPWYDKAKKFRLDPWEDWDEYYADTSKKRFRRLICNDVAPSILSKGFDGLFLDNVDMISDHRPQKKGMKKLVKCLSTLVRGQGRVLFAQNGDDIIDPFVRFLDGWNREDVTSTYNFDTKSYERVSAQDSADAMAKLAELAAEGLLVTAADYAAAQDAATISLAVQNACGAGALPYVSDIDLTLVPLSPFECP